MKLRFKNGIIVFALVLTARECELNAQQIRTWGVKAAVTSADQDFDYTQLDDLKTHRRVGFNVGLFAEWFDNNLFSLLTQLEYAQRGMGQDSFVRFPGTLYSRVDYLSVSIIGKFAASYAVVRPFVLVGPRIDFLLGYKSDEPFRIVYDDFKSIVIGGTVGIGLESSELLSQTIIAEFRYNFDVSYAYKTDLLTVKNNAFDIWLGVAF